MYTLDLNGLNEQQLELVERFVALLRRTNDRKEAAAILRSLLIKQGTIDSLTTEEVERLADEAVHYARSCG